MEVLLTGKYSLNLNPNSQLPTPLSCLPAMPQHLVCEQNCQTIRFQPHLWQKWAFRRVPLHITFSTHQTAGALPTPAKPQAAKGAKCPPRYSYQVRPFGERPHPPGGLGGKGCHWKASRALIGCSKNSRVEKPKSLSISVLLTQTRQGQGRDGGNSLCEGRIILSSSHDSAGRVVIPNWLRA